MIVEAAHKETDDEETEEDEKHLDVGRQSMDSKPTKESSRLNEQHEVHCK